MDARQCFTIWELLVVVAIIALVVGLLMPALSRVRQVSTRMVCGSYMSQYGKVGAIYLGDNDGVFPERGEWLYSEASFSTEHPKGCRWHDRAMAPGGEIMTTNEQYRGKMWTYIGEGQLGPCPTFRRFGRSRGCENPEHNDAIDIQPQNSYTMNGYLGSRREGGVLRAEEVREPGEVFFFSEENPWTIRPDHPRFPAKWMTAPLSTRALDDMVLLISPSPEARDCFATYHGGMRDLNRGHGNAAFMDGHAEAVRVENQLRKNMHGGDSYYGPGGNLQLAWPIESEPPGGWEGQ